MVNQNVHTCINKIKRQKKKKIRHIPSKSNDALFDNVGSVNCIMYKHIYEANENQNQMCGEHVMVCETNNKESTLEYPMEHI